MEPALVPANYSPFPDASCRTAEQPRCPGRTPTLLRLLARDRIIRTISDPLPADSDVRSDRSAMRGRHEWLEIALSGVGDGVIMADAEGGVIYLNPIAERLTGWPLADAGGKTSEQVFRVVNEETRKPVDQLFRKRIEDGPIVRLGNHTLLIGRDGRELHIDRGH